MLASLKTWAAERAELLHDVDRLDMMVPDPSQRATLRQRAWQSVELTHGKRKWWETWQGHAVFLCISCTYMLTMAGILWWMEASRYALMVASGLSAIWAFGGIGLMLVATRKEYYFRDQQLRCLIERDGVTPVVLFLASDYWNLPALKTSAWRFEKYHPDGYMEYRVAAPGGEDKKHA